MADDDRREANPAFTYEVSADESIGEAVVTAVSAATGRVPGPVAEERTAEEDLLDPLYDTLDPKALGAVFRESSTRGRVRFTYADHRVTVHSDGRISLLPLAEPVEAAAD